MARSTNRTATVTLPSDTQILITREFDAPAHMVYRAWTTPELVRRWWSANRGEVVSIEIDLRVGGSWRYVMIADAGFEVAFHGEYREIVPNERLVHTEVFEGMPGAHAVTAVSFEEAEQGTVVSILVDHDTQQARDAHINSGMEDGLQDAMILLEETLQTLA